MKTSNEKIRKLSVSLIIWLASQVGSTQEKHIALQRLLGIYEEKRKNEGDNKAKGVDPPEDRFAQLE